MKSYNDFYKVKTFGIGGGLEVAETGADDDVSRILLYTSPEAIKTRQRAQRKKLFTEAMLGENDSGLQLGKFGEALNKLGIPGVGEKGNVGWGTVALVGVDALNAVDNAVMGDKNFGPLSQAIDTGVHMASNFLMLSGNPYAIAAGAALEGMNFLSKASGQTVQGYSVDGLGSGYSTNLASLLSLSRRGGLLSTLTGSTERMQRLLEKRNENALLALKAANISSEVNYEQEARANSVESTMLENLMALAGATDTSILTAKQGGRLVSKAQDGMLLKNIDVSDTPNVLPTGDLHKDKHDIDLEHITKKGIPVITVDDDSAETFAEIKALEKSIVLHAEVEKDEVIFNKSLTDFLEEEREKWHKSNEDDDTILINVGKRLTKELLYNTTDKLGIIEQLEKKYDRDNA